MSYYNTTNQTGSKLQQSHQKADTQRERILKLFQKFWNDKFTPERICIGYHKHYGQEIDLNSSRRAITGLTNDGYLIKLGSEDKVMGSKGVPVHQWRLNS